MSALRETSLLDGQQNIIEQISRSNNIGSEILIPVKPTEAVLVRIRAIKQQVVQVVDTELTFEGPAIFG